MASSLIPTPPILPAPNNVPVDAVEAAGAPNNETVEVAGAGGAANTPPLLPLLPLPNTLVVEDPNKPPPPPPGEEAGKVELPLNSCVVA